MTTQVIITGTGIPLPAPGRAGPGVVIRHGDAIVLFDTGRGTVGRLSEVGISPLDLDAVFLTHHHSDHTVGLPDLVLTRWILDTQRVDLGPIRIVAPNGPATEFAHSMLGPFHSDINARSSNMSRTGHPDPDVLGFNPTDVPDVVFSEHGLTVSAFSVDHRPLVPAVGYRIETPDGVIVISGDTRVCAEVERAATAADVLVHEVTRLDALRELGRPESWVRNVADYHAEAVALGALAERAEVGHLVLTHYVPSPVDAIAKQKFVDDVRSGGYEGIVTAADDLERITL